MASAVIDLSLNVGRRFLLPLSSEDVVDLGADFQSPLLLWNIQLPSVKATLFCREDLIPLLAPSGWLLRRDDVDDAFHFRTLSFFSLGPPPLEMAEKSPRFPFIVLCPYVICGFFHAFLFPSLPLFPPGCAGRPFRKRRTVLQAVYSAK